MCGSNSDISEESHTVDLVIFACLNFREFLIWELFTKFRIREFLFFFSSAIITIIFARFLNSRICLPREIRENLNLANITRSTVFKYQWHINPYNVELFVYKPCRPKGFFIFFQIIMNVLVISFRFIWIPTVCYGSSSTVIIENKFLVLRIWRL